jgi:hypothetical protein
VMPYAAVAPCPCCCTWQVYPSYFQAPSAADALLPDGLVFKREVLPVVRRQCKQQERSSILSLRLCQQRLLAWTFADRRMQHCARPSL